MLGLWVSHILCVVLDLFRGMVAVIEGEEAGARGKGVGLGEVEVEGHKEGHTEELVVPGINRLVNGVDQTR